MKSSPPPFSKSSIGFSSQTRPPGYFEGARIFFGSRALFLRCFFLSRATPPNQRGVFRRPRGQRRFASLFHLSKNKRPFLNARDPPLFKRKPPLLAVTRRGTFSSGPSSFESPFPPFPEKKSSFLRRVPFPLSFSFPPSKRDL